MLVFSGMRRIDKLILQAIIPPTFISLVVLTFVVFIREFGRLSELLITRNASLEVIGLIASMILPNILIFSLPMSFLIGVLVGLSGLSGESQITALRACGVPLRRMLTPVLVFGSAIGAVTAILSILILPLAIDTLNTLKDRISLRHVTTQIEPRVFAEHFPNMVFYLDDLSLDRQSWSRVFLIDNTKPLLPRVILAREGRWVTDAKGSRFQIHLENGIIYEFNSEEPNHDNISTFATIQIPVDFKLKRNSQTDDSSDTKSKKPIELSTAELWWGSPAFHSQEQREREVELHRRLSLPFSVLGFALLGLSLATSTQRGGRTTGFVLSFILLLFFYNLLMGGIRLALVGKVSPWIGAWGGNLVLLSIGIVLLAAAERGFWHIHWIGNLGSRKKLELLGHQLHLDAAHDGIQKLDSVIGSSRHRLARLRFPKIIDIYVSRGFCVYFLWCTIVCAALFVILTLFDLLDDIIRNQIPVSYVIDYFVFLMPYILQLVVPMSILLGVLINFGILEKSSEVTALKAGGWSLYRISTPVFLLASVLCVGLYFMQDYYLPYANIRQDSIRNVIKGRPAQTTMRPQRKWIFGEDNRIFNYDYFDPGQKVFIGLNVYEVDLCELRILRKIHASRAVVGDSGRWTLQDGWVRDFRSGKEGFHKIGTAPFFFPEKAAYFQKEIFQPTESSKLTYLELKSYINYLRKAGYNATELQVALYRKLSFPLSCVVMALVGVPFSFAMGRKGAFFGITMSIVVAISYWGVFGVFEQMGAYGLLMPLLAAWAPNILFGAAGLALLLTIRT